jgi:hypothetical protein
MSTMYDLITKVKSLACIEFLGISYTDDALACVKMSYYLLYMR